MEEGVKEFGAETGINASLVGPAQADAAQQIPIIEDLIAQGVDALCVIPMDPEQLDPVLQKAMDAGIVVVTHEASNQQSMHFDIEAFDNRAYGAGLMDQLAALMGEEGEYAVFVGSLGSKTQRMGGWAIEASEATPMTMVGDGSFDDADRLRKDQRTCPGLPNQKRSTDVPGSL